MKLPALSWSHLSFATVASAILFFFSLRVEEPIGWLLWVAPIPVLMTALQARAVQTLLVAFLAHFAGRLSLMFFLWHLLPPALAILLTVMIAVVYALVVAAFRQVARFQSPWAAVLAYPVLMTAAEFVTAQLSYDGTAGSTAYSQSNYITVIQLASFGGIWAIVFFTGLIPSAIVMMLYYRNSRFRQTTAALVSLGLLLAAGLYCISHQFQQSAGEADQVALICEVERLHPIHVAEPSARNQLLEGYTRLIGQAADQGADIVLFPEKVFTVRTSEKDSLIRALHAVASSHRLTLIGGLAVLGDTSWHNLAVLIGPDGHYEEYQKNFHVQGWEDRFVSGGVPGILSLSNPSAGLAVCKDLDYPTWMRQYALVNVLYVPAWDFTTDGWLHSRMAILRGVENGYNIVRAARQGRLTVSDGKGNVLAESSTEDGQSALLLASVPRMSSPTLYSQYGDWIGWGCGLLALTFLAFARRTELPGTS